MHKALEVILVNSRNNLCGDLVCFSVLGAVKVIGSALAQRQVTGTGPNPVSSNLGCAVELVCSVFPGFVYALAEVPSGLVVNLEAIR